MPRKEDEEPLWAGCAAGFLLLLGVTFALGVGVFGGASVAFWMICR